MEYRRLGIRGADYLIASAGSGPAVLLLHGFPQTHFCWRRIVWTIAEQHTVVAPDLRGYGATSAPEGGPEGQGFSKREMANDLVDLMNARGLALDHPDRVERLVVLNVLPTLEQFERMSAGLSLAYWPWFLLAQPSPFPERLIAANREHFLRSIFDSWTHEPGAIDDEAFDEYLRALSEPTIASICADYRASFWLDQRDDAADRRAGRLIECPVLLITGSEETQLADAPAIWRSWARDLRATVLPGGHFIPEEASEQLASVLVAFLDGRTAMSQ
jgi:haloacetate dehalogenase